MIISFELGNLNYLFISTIYRSGNTEEGYTAADAAWYKNIYGRAITFAYQNGTTVITSAGNDAIDFDHSADLMHLPSGAAHAISISATAPYGWAYDQDTNLDEFASYTNFGQSEIDFAAPGGDFDWPLDYWYYDMVLSTGNGGWYWGAGKSMAAPHATGVAALIIGKNGGSMDPAKVEAALKASADDLGKPGNDDYYGQGRVNAFRAVTQ
ncbi:MAG: S8 family serine peptidase [Bacteroidota bacterium]